MHRQLYKYSYKAKLSKQAAVHFQVVKDDVTSLKTSYEKEELWGRNKGNYFRKNPRLQF